MSEVQIHIPEAVDAVVEQFNEFSLNQKRAVLAVPIADTILVAGLLYNENTTYGQNQLALLGAEARFQLQEQSLHPNQALLNQDARTVATLASKQPTHIGITEGLILTGGSTALSAMIAFGAVAGYHKVKRAIKGHRIDEELSAMLRDSTKS